MMKKFMSSSSRGSRSAAIGAAGGPSTLGLRTLIVIGPTGAGKSTLLSSIHNFLRGNDYGHLEQPYKTGQSIHSTTKDCKEIIMQYKGEKLLIIDTAGLGDTDGAEQDQLNLQNVLSAMIKVQRLVGFLIVMNGSECKGTTQLKYVLNQMRSMFPASFKNRVILFLTNSSTKPTFQYDQVDILRDLVGAVHYYNNPVFCQVDDSDKEEVQEMWEKSCRKIDNLLTFVMQQEPLDTAVFKEIADNIEAAKEALLDCTQQISNIRALRSTKQQLDAQHSTLMRVKNGMTAKVQVPHIEFKKEDTPYHSTICVKHEGSICHERCQLTYTPNHNKIFDGCFAMQGSHNCRVCECPSEKHLHVNYKMVRVESMVDSVDKQVEQQIAEHAAAIKKLEDDSNQKLSEEQKLRVVLDAAIQQLSDHFSTLKSLCPWYNHTDDIEVMIQRLQQEKKDSTEVQEREDLDVVIQALKRINAELNAKQGPRSSSSLKKSALKPQLQTPTEGGRGAAHGRQPNTTSRAKATEADSSSDLSWGDSDGWMKVDGTPGSKE
jgi:predicted GTPase